VTGLLPTTVSDHFFLGATITATRADTLRSAAPGGRVALPFSQEGQFSESTSYLDVAARNPSSVPFQARRNCYTVRRDTVIVG